MKIKSFIFFALLLLVNMGISGAVASPSIWAEVSTAYYADLDNDLLADDIYVEITVTLSGIDNSLIKDGIFYGVYFTLILPSGFEYNYLIYDVATDTQFIIYLNLLNHATESGWYQTITSATFDQFGAGNVLPAHYFLFDPPGGQKGGEPIVLVWK